MPQKKRVLYIAHGHPDFAYGGAEWAAYYMYESMKDSDAYEPFFLAHYDRTQHQHAGCHLIRHEADDHVHLFSVAGHNYDHFYNTLLCGNFDYAIEPYIAFREFLESLRPDVIHFHHYLHMGIELVAYSKSVLPDLKIVMTLHEFMPICGNRGSMIKTQTNQLCFGASPLKCSGCFPERTPAEFFLRERFFKANFAHVDRFVAPSQFLQDRFVEWGLEADRFLQVDYGRPIWPKRGQSPRREGQPFVVAFFGQIVFHKGVDVFLRAALEYRMRRKRASEQGENKLPEVRFAVHGSMDNLTDDNVRETIHSLTEQCQDVAHVHGAYDARNMQALLSRVDCVVVPSKWWENSPLVIQEAFMVGVPVIASNIGGMAERVTHRVNGLQFVVGNHFDLLNQILELAGSPSLYAQLVEGIPDIISDAEMANQMHVLYDELQRESSQAHTTKPGLMSAVSKECR